MPWYREQMERGELLTEHPHEKTWRTSDGPDLVIKARRVPERMLAGPGRMTRAAVDDARVPAVDSIPLWRALTVATSEDLRFDEDGEGTWLVAARPWVDGRPLRSIVDKDHDFPTSWLDAALEIALALQNLHDVDCPHGDLQPGNIVIDENDDIRLIDFPVLATTPEDIGHVAGSAPLMAPELWAGEEPNPKSDVYAVGALTCWLASRGTYPLETDSLARWATLHRNREPTVPDALSGKLGGVVGRMLSKSADRRPSLQEFADVLRTEGARADAPPLIPLQTNVDEMVQSALDSFTSEGAEQLVVPPGRSDPLTHRAFYQLARRAELLGHPVVELSGQLVQAPPLDDSGAGDDPWSAARQIIAAASAHGETEIDVELQEVRGDQLHVFERATRRLLKAAPDDELSVIWHRYDAVGPDIRAWWNHVLDRASNSKPFDDRQLRIRTVASTARNEPLRGAQRQLLVRADAKDWKRWRMETLRAEVRDVAEGRWNQLVDQHGSRPSALLDALHAEVGARELQRAEPEDDAADETGFESASAALQRVRELIRRGALERATELCATASEFEDADDQVISQILAAWTEAIRLGGGGPENTSRLEETLTERRLDDRRPIDAGTQLIELLHTEGRYGDGLDVVDELTDNFADSLTDFERARLELWRAQLFLSSGKFDDAGEHARRGLEHLDGVDETPDLDRVETHLQVLEHASGAIHGDAADIEALASLAPKLETSEVAPQIVARCHAYRAMGLTRSDQFDDAADAYLRALEVIENAGLDAELPTYLLNVGTAYHRQGRLGLAREYYARGARISQPNTRASTRALLLANQANIDHALGRLDESMALVDRARELAETHDLDSVLVLCHTIEGIVELAHGNFDRALSCYTELLDDDDRAVSTFRRAELLLHAAEASLHAEDLEASQSYLDDARRVIEEEQLSDLEAYQGMLRARLQWTERGSLGVMAGIELFRRSLLEAADAGNHKLVLRQSPHLWERVEEEQLDELMEEVAEIVHRSRNAIAMGLTRQLRQDFFDTLADIPSPEDFETEEEPEKRSIEIRGREGRRRPSGQAKRSADGDLIERFYRMLSLNEVILHSESLGSLWPRALDIAISLSGAERGFILMRDPDRGRVGEYEVAATRDSNGNPIPEPHLEVSLTIAEEAASTGRTVVTVNAMDDERFNAALSVVDLELTSVLCVPVQDSNGLLGALYLDHQLQPGLFEGEVSRMMESFGHQLALAITNIRRRKELEEERERLQEMKDQLDELLQERELMLEGLEDRVEKLNEEVERQRMQGAGSSAEFPDIVYTSRAMENIMDQVNRVARSDISVVVTGESGVGKELVARAVHDKSTRSDEAFVPFNCGAVSQSLFESEMFGHLEGSFTGAERDKQGLFQAASGGTLFLDEVGEMPLEMQVKLLRALQEGEVRRVGATESEQVDVRILAATNQNLEKMVEQGDFREDLYYRLATIVLEIPPLRDRREDIPLVAKTLLERIADGEDGPDKTLRPAAARLLTQATWTGNVRELENTLRAAYALSDGDTLDESDIAPLIRIRDDDDDDGAGAARRRTPAQPSQNAGKSKRGRKPKAKRREVVEALRRANDDRQKAAEQLGVSERTLYRYLNRFDLH